MNLQREADHTKFSTLSSIYRACFVLEPLAMLEVVQWQTLARLSQASIFGQFRTHISRLE